jgi:hypothetical protein
MHPVLQIFFGGSNLMGEIFNYISKIVLFIGSIWHFAVLASFKRQMFKERSIHNKTFYECNMYILLQKGNGQNIMDTVITLILLGELLKMQR